MGTIEISDKLEIVVGQDKIFLTTATNGDELRIRGLHLENGQAATLAYLINHGTDLSIEIKSAEPIE